MDTTIPAKFVWNKDTEVERVLHAAINISSGFYNRKNFLVLPNLLDKLPSVVAFPDIGWQKIPHFWEKVKYIHNNFPISAPIKLKEEIRERIDSTLMIDSHRLEKLEKVWKKTEIPFWRFLIRLMRKNLSYLKSIEVRLTSFGSISSYKFLQKRSNQELICYLRIDAGLGHLAEAIMTGLIYPDVDDFSLTWDEREGLVDFVLTKSEIAKFFSDYKPTLYELRRIYPSYAGLQPKGLSKQLRGSYTRANSFASGIDNDLKLKSLAYQRKLGISFAEPLVLRDGCIYFRNRSIESHLSNRQRAILALLINKEGKVVSVDEVSEALWKNEDEFSLWALNKFMQRLRNKLVSLGANPVCLKTLRRRGYVFENI